MKEHEYQYEAKILRVDGEHKVMEVVYSSPGRQEILCGVRLPETEDDIGPTIHDAVPFGVWQEAERSVFVPLVGTVVKGVVRAGSALPLPSHNAPAIPFYAPPNQGAGHGHSAATQEEIGGFPTRYVPDVEPSGQREPEVTL
jgi:hypothetical protein